MCLIFFWLVDDDIGRGVRDATFVNAKLLHGYFWILTLVALIGFARNGGALNIYAEWRALLLLGIGFLLFASELNTGSARIATVLAFSATAVGLLDWFFGRYFQGSVDDLKYASPIFSSAVAGVLSALTGKRANFFFALILAIVSAAIGFYRQYWIIVFLILIVGLLNHRRMHLFDRAGGAVGIVMLIFSSTFVFQGLKSAVEEDERLYIQSVGKTNDLVELMQGTAALTESDALRQGYFLFLVEEPLAMLIPNGLGSKAAFGRVHPWFDQFTIPPNTLDSVIFYVSYHFGLVFIIPLFYFLGVLAVRFSKANGVLQGGTVVAIIFVPMFFDGGAITIAPRAFWFGALLGMLYWLPSITTDSQGSAIPGAGS